MAVWDVATRGLAGLDRGVPDSALPASLRRRKQHHLRLLASGATSSATRSASPGRSGPVAQRAVVTARATQRPRRHRARAGPRRVIPYVVTKNVPRVRRPTRTSRDQQSPPAATSSTGITPNVTARRHRQSRLRPGRGRSRRCSTSPPSRPSSRSGGPSSSRARDCTRFQLNCYIVVDCNTDEGLFYSRRIGRSPQLPTTTATSLTATSTPISAPPRSPAVCAAG